MPELRLSPPVKEKVQELLNKKFRYIRLETSHFNTDFKAGYTSEVLRNFEKSNNTLARILLKNSYTDEYNLELLDNFILTITRFEIIYEYLVIPLKKLLPGWTVALPCTFERVFFKSIIDLSLEFSMSPESETPVVTFELVYTKSKHSNYDLVFRSFPKEKILPYNKPELFCENVKKYLDKLCVKTKNELKEFLNGSFIED